MPKFIDNYTKDLDKAGIYSGEAKPPRYWFSTGNYALNRIISGNFHKGIPQGRVIGLMGPSGAGKSFLLANIMKNAQDEGAFVLAVDTEHALDKDFVEPIGVNTSPDHYKYVEANTFEECKKAVSSFIQAYKKDPEYGDSEKAERILIAIDSLDMLITETEQTHFQKGVMKGDQGQRSKQVKSILREFVQSIKHNNISIVATGDVYKNQDPLNGEGNWIVTEAVRFSLSQIILLTKLKLKVDSDIIGINMRCYGFKTRFTKPFQRVEIEVPYDTGMNPYSGLIEAAKALGVVIQKGAWYNIKGGTEKFYAKDIAKYAEKVLELCEAEAKTFLVVNSSEEAELEGTTSVKQRRLEKLSAKDK